jgi:hypothetical protein
VYSIYLTLLLGIPQTLWRERHLAHHRRQAFRFRSTCAIAVECGLVLISWGLLLFIAPRFFWTTYLPGYAVGLFLCYLHGYFEHEGGTTSHYGLTYNISFFNDGYHVEHHAHPGQHWSRLPNIAEHDSKSSRWPAVLRWVECVNLERLERFVLRSPLLQRFLLTTHERALRTLISKLSDVRTVTIVGGGMYPRTAILLHRILPGASIRIMDASEEHLEEARHFLNSEVEFVHARYNVVDCAASDLLVIPLAFSGSRAEIYRKPGAPAVLVHDWIWSRRGYSAIVSVLLLKRLNLILR